MKTPGDSHRGSKMEFTQVDGHVDDQKLLREHLKNGICQFCLIVFSMIYMILDITTTSPFNALSFEKGAKGKARDLRTSM